MTSHVDREPSESPATLGKLRSVSFSCDHPGCTVVAHDTEIPMVGGLIGLGWECRGGKHFCPDHKNIEGEK